MKKHRSTTILIETPDDLFMRVAAISASLEEQLKILRWLVHDLQIIEDDIMPNRKHYLEIVEITCIRISARIPGINQLKRELLDATR